MAGGRLEQAPWWAVKRASSRAPRTYRCPICGRHLHAMSEHVIIAPEGDFANRRRHAHSACVAAARLPSRADWLRAHPRPPAWWRRLLRRP